MQYIYPSHAASSVDSALKANFTSPDAIDLIVCKHTRLEVYSFLDDTLELKLEVPLNGSITAMHAVQLPTRDTAALLLLTSNNRIFGLVYDAESKSVITEASLSIAERAGRPADYCQKIASDADGAFLAVHAYNGLLRVIPLAKPKRRKSKAVASEEDKLLVLERSYNIRLPDYNVHDFAIFPIPDNPPLLIVLHDNHLNQKALKIRPFQENFRDIATDPGDFQDYILDDPGSELLIPVPGYGAIIVGEEQAVYIDLTDGQKVDRKGKGKARSSSNASKSPTSPSKRKGTKLETVISCRLPLDVYNAFEPIPGRLASFFLGDIHGNLHILEAILDGDSIAGLTIQECGHTSSPRALVALDGVHCFVGSHYGDSQLVKVTLPQQSAKGADEMDVDEEPEASTSQPSLEAVDTFMNLAPIVDFAVVENEHQSHVVTCSGSYNDGSLRIVSHGVGLSELASFELENVQRIWATKRESEGSSTDLLVLSFVNETRLLQIGTDEDSIEEVDSLDGFQLGLPTVAAFSYDGVVYQVTKEGVSGSNGARWSAADKAVTIAAQLGEMVTLGLSGGELLVLKICEEGQLAQIGDSSQLPQDIAALTMVNDYSGEALIAVALWTTQEILFLRSTGLSEPFKTVTVPSTFLIRSLLVAKFDDASSTFFVGLGDGSLTSYAMDADQTIREETRKSMVVGTRPVALEMIETAQGRAVFASSDTPTIISRSKGRFNYSTVNLRNIAAFSTFDAAAFPNSLVLASADTIRIGRIEGTQKMHIRTILLGADQPRRIVWAPSLKAYGLLCIREELDRSTGVEVRTSSFKIVDESFDILLDYELEDGEQGMSITLAKLNDPPVDHFVIGCSTILPNERQSKRGRLVAFNFGQDGQFAYAGSASVDGAPYALAPVASSFLAATVNAELSIFTMEKESLNKVGTWAGTFLASTLATREDLLLVGDALRSAILLRFDASERTLQEVAREYTAHGILSLEILDQDKFIAADVDLNLFTMTKGVVQNGDRKDGVLQQAGLYHLGEVVTCLRRGSLLPRFARPSMAANQQLLYASSSGSIGVVTELDAQTSELLSSLQRNLRRVVPCVGDLDHSEWRQFRDETRVADSVGFIDGAFVEQWSHLTAAQMEQVIAGRSQAEKLNLSAEGISGIVEELSRLSS